MYIYIYILAMSIHRSCLPPCPFVYL